MSRESRIVLVLVAFAIVAVLVLGWMAQRYAKILERDPPAESEAAR